MEAFKIKEILVNKGLKVTQQRIMVYSKILDMHNHPTAEQVYNQVKEVSPGISLATVYNILEIFAEKDLIRKMFTEEGSMRYDPKTEAHGHIYCSNTSEFVDYYDEELNDLIINFFKKKKVSNLHINHISLQINGDKIDPEKSVAIK